MVIEKNSVFLMMPREALKSQLETQIEAGKKLIDPSLKAIEVDLAGIDEWIEQNRNLLKEAFTKEGNNYLQKYNLLFSSGFSRQATDIAKGIDIASLEYKKNLKEMLIADIINYLKILSKELEP